MNRRTALKALGCAVVAPATLGGHSGRPVATIAPAASQDVLGLRARVEYEQSRLILSPRVMKILLDHPEFYSPGALPAWEES